MFSVDNDGSLTLTYDVSVNCHGKRAFHLGTGSSAVSKFYDIAKTGIPGAKKAEFLWGYNVLVTLSGDILLGLIREHYPELADNAVEHIDPDSEYEIDCYDMS